METQASQMSRKKILSAVIVVIILVVIIAFAVYWLFVRPAGLPWLFKGAYAKYHGETTVLGFTIKLDVRFEVVDYNSTHAKLLLFMKADTPFGSQEYQNVTWSDLTKKNL